ncbi:MAG: xanthine dehydrogenase family protein subunit M [Casimicrobiaceae bacterium]
MHPFQLHKATSAAQASTLLAGKADGKFLAGGQSLIAAMKLRLNSPSDLIDLGSAADLKGIKSDGKTVTIGAMTTHAEVAASADVQKAIPALASLARLIGDRQVRNVGTIGGSIANNDPAADYPAAVLGLNATINTNKRAIPADQFFRGLYDTTLEAGELITSVSFPIPQKAAYMKFRNPASRFAMVGVMVAQTAGGVRVAVTGGGAGVFRVADMEKALASNWSADAIAGIKVPESGLSSDLHASAEYRAHLIGVMARRAVAAA